VQSEVAVRAPAAAVEDDHDGPVDGEFVQRADLAGRIGQRELGERVAHRYDSRRDSTGGERSLVRGEHGDYLYGQTAGYGGLHVADLLGNRCHRSSFLLSLIDWTERSTEHGIVTSNGPNSPADRLGQMTRAQPATAKGRETRERIVRAAAELVAERGVAGTPLDDVRARAQASKSQLYHYFADRDDLLRAVARTTSDDVVGGQAELFERLDTIDGLRAWTDALVTLQQSRHAKGGCPIGSLAGQLAEQDEGARLALADGLHRWESAIREGLERMAARGELRPDADPGALAQRTLAAVQGGLLLTQIRRDPSQLRCTLDGALNAILAARAVP
jgi:TetR/AcrR family transcriptional regulator, transcriptional repressor for nem operon